MKVVEKVVAATDTRFLARTAKDNDDRSVNNRRQSSDTYRPSREEWPNLLAVEEFFHKRETIES